MYNPLSKVEKDILNYIVKGQVRQSSIHAQNITELYKLINQAAVKEFTEDSPMSLKAFLQERFDIALDNMEF